MPIHRDDDRIALLRAFNESARYLSFVAAATALDLTPSALGRRIQRLEAHLGVALFMRTTRRIALTEAGIIYRRYSERILAELEEADAAAASLGTEPTGLLRLTAPTTFGRLHLNSRLVEFANRYPTIQLDVIYTDQYVDIVEQRIDVAIRIGELANSSLHARKIAPNVRRLVASPAYLALAPQLETPQDLAQHRLLHFSYLTGGDIWTLMYRGAVETITVKSRLRANDAYLLYQAALAGQGIALLADFITEAARQAGDLVAVLPQWQLSESTIYAVYASSGFIPPKTRAFIDFLVDDFAKNQALLR